MSKKLTAIIGYPLEHTLSPALHGYVYRQLGIEAEMLVLADLDLGNLIRQIKKKSIELIAVTIPHKQEIIKFLDKVEERALAIGAVNTVINKDGKLHGYNTDIVGIEKVLEYIDLKEKNVLLLGAGGAARPAAYLINKQGGKLLCFNRTKDKAEKLAEKFGGQVVDLKSLKSEDFDVIVNSTPIGMHPNTDTPIDLNLLGSHQIVFDMVYNPLETKLLKEAKIKGAKVISGLEMFVAQGLEQIRLWTGRKYNY